MSILKSECVTLYEITIKKGLNLTFVINLCVQVLIKCLHPASDRSNV